MTKKRAGRGNILPIAPQTYSIEVLGRKRGDPHLVGLDFQLYKPYNVYWKSLRGSIDLDRLRSTMKSSKFATRLRELRKQTGMSQREVAQRVGIDFTYLSKIESGAMSPPSEKVIVKLAKVLDAEKDELITLAGKVPSDLSQILKDKEVLQFLRSSDHRRLIRSWRKEEEE